MFVLPQDSRDLRFPPVELASPEGLLAVGGDLSPDRLLTAYRQGIFPWYSGDQPILWWSPDPRAVLFLDRLKISRSLRKILRSGRFRVTLDTAFGQVIRACAAPRPGPADTGTWITADMIRAYERLHALGAAHSVETWLDDELAGGLYGVAAGRAFFGESMFSNYSNASKVALTYLVKQLQLWEFALIDCQMPSGHLFSLGAENISRAQFNRLLADACAYPDRPGPWHLTPELAVT